jgi:hypothetical protein
MFSFKTEKLWVYQLIVKAQKATELTNQATSPLQIPVKNKIAYYHQ